MTPFDIFLVSFLYLAAGGASMAWFLAMEPRGGSDMAAAMILLLWPIFLPVMIGARLFRAFHE